MCFCLERIQNSAIMLCMSNITRKRSKHVHNLLKVRDHVVMKIVSIIVFIRAEERGNEFFDCFYCTRKSPCEGKSRAIFEKLM